MGFFERPDPRLAQSADPQPLAAIGRTLGRHAIGLGFCMLALACGYTANVAYGLHEAGRSSGVLVVRGLQRPVTVVRDSRDIPHVRASNEHDLYFAEGFLQGSDRLFQLDLTRRYAYGTLAEVLGPKALQYDKAQRAVDIAGIAHRQWRGMAPQDRAAVAAFSEGVNAAASTQPLPVEFRMLLYMPARWTPQDSLAVSIVASLELSDSWHDIFARDVVWRDRGAREYAAAFPLSDARYDVTIDGQSGTPARERTAYVPAHHAIGSNAWATGAEHSVDGHALLANDPHLDLTIPGIWYLVDLQSPQVHAAGATIPGMPGVVLGHNERVAWASTNAAMATTSLFKAGRMQTGSWVIETIRVRFSRDVRVPYYRTSREFSVPDDNDRSAIALVRWPIYGESYSTIATALALDRARSMNDALAIVARYCGSPQNFVLADRRGAVAWHVAGLVPSDPAWGRYVHPARDLRDAFPALAFGQLPGRAPSRGALLVSANNKTYAPGYPYRLSAQFEPPYRAYRIAQLLRAQKRYDAGYFARMQLDTLSPIDLEIARDVVRLERSQGAQESDATAAMLDTLERWDGRYRSSSRAAALEHAIRGALFDEISGARDRLSELRDDRSDTSGVADDVRATLAFFTSANTRAWGEVGATRIEHPLAPMRFGFLNGVLLPGEGDEYTIHLQEPGFAQGFRAVWDVGDWDSGGISIPSGESGEPGSGHYTDLTRDWVAGVLRPLPFSDAAVARDAAGTMVLRPPPRN